MVFPGGGKFYGTNFLEEKFLCNKCVVCVVHICCGYVSESVGVC